MSALMWSAEELERHRAALKNKPYFYRCGNDHESSARKPLRRCPVARCQATLKQIGGPKG